MKFFEQCPENKSVGTSKNKELVILLKEWVCSWTYCNRFRSVVIPAGYVWDGMSVPRWAWTISGLTPNGLGDGPSLIHDALYRCAGGAKASGLHGCIINDSGTAITKKEADWVLKEAMKSVGFNKAQCFVAIAAVTVAGKKYWGGKSPSGVA